MTKRVTELKSLAAVQQAAADWCARRIDDDFSPREEQTFQAWLNADARHAREFKAIEALWADSATVAEYPAVQDIRADVAHQAASVAEDAVKPSRARWPLAVAAVLAVAAIGIGWFATEQFRAGPAVLVTERGEQSRATLDDGTFVELDADSQLSIAYSDSERRVILETGQAHFDVRKDPDRPFIVVAGGSEIHALGTSFQVYRRPDRVTVTLLEGRVEVVSANSRPVSDVAVAPAWKKELVPGEQLTLTIAKPVTPEVISVDVNRVTAWQRGVMDFDALTLPEVVAELNRYSDIPVLIADPALNDTRVSGVFAIGDTETLLLALETGFGIDARPRPESGDIALYPAAARR